jgi:ATP-dependent Clp protease protease subunit
MKGIIDKIFDITYDDDLKIGQFAKFERKPIQLYINSGGGSIYNGLALVDLIRTNETPIYTYCFGSAMSMGLWIYLAASKRYLGRNSTLLYHEVSSFVYDKLEGIKREVEEMERLQSMYDDIVKKNSLITQDKLTFVRDRKSDWYISAEESLRLGLCHEIL